jgi:hypothetical protein
VRGPKSKQPHTPATTGLKLIIAYKALKAPVMLGIAVWLTVAPSQAYATFEWVAEELSAANTFFSPLGDWIANHLSLRTLRGGAFIAWLDGLFTAAEAVLLVLRKPWSEWMVAIGLALLLPFELISVIRKPRIGKIAVLVINAAVVAYLVRRRINQRRLASTEEPEARTASISHRT